MTHGDGVEPAATPRPPGGDAELLPDLPQPLADFARVFSGERTTADAGGVCLGHTDYGVHIARRQAAAGEHAGGRCSRSRSRKDSCRDRGRGARLARPRGAPACRRRGARAAAPWCRQGAAPAWGARAGDPLYTISSTENSSSGSSARSNTSLRSAAWRSVACRRASGWRKTPSCRPKRPALSA